MSFTRLPGHSQTYLFLFSCRRDCAVSVFSFLDIEDHRLIPRSGASSNALNRVSNLTILGCWRYPPSIFFFLPIQFLGKMLYFSVKKGINHSHRDLNSVSSSTDKTNLLGPIPSRLRGPAPRVLTRAAASSAGGITSLTLKPAACNSGVDQHSHMWS